MTAAEVGIALPVGSKSKKYDRQVPLYTTKVIEQIHYNISWVWTHPKRTHQ